MNKSGQCRATVAMQEDYARDIESVDVPLLGQEVLGNGEGGS